MTEETIMTADSNTTLEESKKRFLEVINDKNNEKLIEDSDAMIICIMGIQNKKSLENEVSFNVEGCVSGVFTSFGNLPNVISLKMHMDKKVEEAIISMMEQGVKKQ